MTDRLTPDKKLRIFARDLIEYRRRVGIKGDLEELARIHNIEIALNEAEREDEKSEDTLFKTADSLMRYYAEEGSKAFVARFGSLEILEACRKIIREGEGNPHPWESEE